MASAPTFTNALVGIHSLKNKKELNGKRGVITGFTGTERWKVQMCGPAFRSPANPTGTYAIRSSSLWNLDPTNEWRRTTSASRFDQIGMMACFNAPGAVETLPCFDQVFRGPSSLPDLEQTLAFWGPDVFTYMRQQLLSSLDSMSKPGSLLQQFRGGDFQIGLVYCDGTKQRQMEPRNPSGIVCCNWGPVL